MQTNEPDMLIVLQRLLPARDQREKNSLAMYVPIVERFDGGPAVSSHAESISAGMYHLRRYYEPGIAASVMQVLTLLQIVRTAASGALPPVIRPRCFTSPVPLMLVEYFLHSSTISHSIIALAKRYRLNRIKSAVQTVI